MPPHRLAAPVLCVSLLHCGGDATDNAAPITTLSLVTFNAALGVGLAPYALERLDAIERDLPELNADVLCFQEIWQPENIDRLVAALASRYPYHLRSVRAQDGDGLACTESEAALLSGCLAESCAGVDPEGLPLCAIASCAEPFTQVSMGCQQCIAANQSASDIARLTQICSSAEADAAAFADQSGLLLLSRYPLEELGYFPFESALGDRGLLSARLGTAFLGEIDLHCTHLAASLSEVPYTGPHGSWQGERLRQIEQLLGRVAETGGDAAVLMGDMNCGPSTARAGAASPDAYARLVDAGFADPYVEADGRCTFCQSNPLNGLTSDPDEGALIDHVMLLAASAPTSAARRVLDQEISVDADAGPLDTAYSDHYGVLVQLGAPGAAQP